MDDVVRGRMAALPTIRRGTVTPRWTLPDARGKRHRLLGVDIQRPAYVWPDGVEMPIAIVSDPYAHPLIDAL